MAIETLGDAFAAGWRIRVRCAWGPRESMNRIRECVYGAELDLPTLVWTRGRDFPLGRLESRLKCPPPIETGNSAIRATFQPARGARTSMMPVPHAALNISEKRPQFYFVSSIRRGMNAEFGHVGSLG